MAATGYDSSFFAKLLMISQRRIQQLAKDGVIPQPIEGKYDLVKTIQGYVKFLQDRVHGGGSSTDLNKEKIRLTSANANKVEIEVEVLKGTLIPAEVVAQVWSDQCTAFKQKVLSLPTKLSHQLSAIQDATQIEALLKSHVKEAMQELSEYCPTDYGIGLSPRATDSDESSTEESEASAGFDGI